MSEIFDPTTAIYTPQQVATYGYKAVEDAHNNKARGLSLGIEGIDGYFAPVMPGQVCVITGQTSHYKSGVLHFIEHRAADQLIRQGRDDEIIIHVSVEECVEEQAFLEFARQSGEEAGDLARGNVQNWDILKSVTVKVGNVPIYRIGDSLARAEDMPNLYMSNMIRAIKTLRDEVLDWRPKIAGLFFDYLQAFPIDPEIKTESSRDAQRRLQVRSDFYRLRQASRFFECPVFVASQAKQELKGANPPIMLPGVYDNEESSGIGQRADRNITLWMPKMTHPVGTSINLGATWFKVEENMLFLKVAKQRGGLPSGKSWPCRVDFRTNMIEWVPL